jgi:ferritin-like metal-binding protein YciE
LGTGIARVSFATGSKPVHSDSEKVPMSVRSISELFVNELRDIYSAEKQLTRALPKMAKAAQHPELRQAFEMHLEQTRGQIDRLDQIFEQLDMPKRAKKCEAMEGLIEEAQAQMMEIESKALLDVGMIISAQKVEHYEIAAYGSLVALAKQLGHNEAVTLLEQTLTEEKETDQKLNVIASTVNAEAVNSGVDEDEAKESGERQAKSRGGRKASSPAM